MTTLDPELGHSCGGWQNVCQAGYDLRGSYTSVKTLHFGVSLCLNLYSIQAEMSGRHLGSEGKSGKEVRV